MINFSKLSLGSVNGEDHMVYQTFKVKQNLMKLLKF